MAIGLDHSVKLGCFTEVKGKVSLVGSRLLTLTVSQLPWIVVHLVESINSINFLYGYDDYCEFLGREPTTHNVHSFYFSFLQGTVVNQRMTVWRSELK